MLSSKYLTDIFLLHWNSCTRGRRDRRWLGKSWQRPGRRARSAPSVRGTTREVRKISKACMWLTVPCCQCLKMSLKFVRYKCCYDNNYMYRENVRVTTSTSIKDMLSMIINVREVCKEQVLLRQQLYVQRKRACYYVNKYQRNVINDYKCTWNL